MTGPRIRIRPNHSGGYCDENAKRSFANAMVSVGQAAQDAMMEASGLLEYVRGDAKLTAFVKSIVALPEEIERRIVKEVGANYHIPSVDLAVWRIKRGQRCKNGQQAA
jgi:hypothetical protein